MPKHCTRRPLLQRFWQHVEITDTCWLWKGGTARKGYGSFHMPRRRMRPAHRISYILEYGPIRDGLFVCHRCDTPACVRPDHLFLGTNTDNMRDCASKGRVYVPMTQLGERHHFAKLSDEQVRHIRARYVGGETQKGLAREFGVTQQTIWNLVHYRVRKTAH